jgi:hypothetical protein
VRVDLRRLLCYCRERCVAGWAEVNTKVNRLDVNTLILRTDIVVVAVVPPMPTIVQFIEGASLLATNAGVIDDIWYAALDMSRMIGIPPAPHARTSERHPGWTWVLYFCSFALRVIVVTIVVMWSFLCIRKVCIALDHAMKRLMSRSTMGCVTMFNFRLQSKGIQTSHFSSGVL